jgi:hypothetical protein
MLVAATAIAAPALENIQTKIFEMKNVEENNLTHVVLLNERIESRIVEELIKRPAAESEKTTTVKTVETQTDIVGDVERKKCDCDKVVIFKGAVRPGSSTSINSNSSIKNSYSDCLKKIKLKNSNNSLSCCDDEIIFQKPTPEVIL